MTTTEVADQLVGGVLPAGPDRLGAIAAHRACPTSARAARSTWSTSAPSTPCPSASPDRLLYVHNPQVTLMRTTADENAAVRRAGSPTSSTRATGPVRFLIPEGGVSALDAPGQPFYDPEADAALFATIEQRVDQTARPPGRSRLPLHINDPAFAARRSSRHFARDRSRRGIVMAAIRRAEHASTRFRDMIDRRVPIVGGGAGTGLSAKCEEAGGIDLIVIYNSGRYRMAGRGSLAGLLAYGNANEIVVDMAARGAAGGEAHAGARRRQRHRSVLPAARRSSPSSKRLGFAGVQNFPTVGLIDGVFRAEPRRDRHGLRPRGRHDRRSPTSSTC